MPVTSPHPNYPPNETQAEILLVLLLFLAYSATVVLAFLLLEFRGCSALYRRIWVSIWRLPNEEYEDEDEDEESIYHAAWEEGSARSFAHKYEYVYTGPEGEAMGTDERVPLIPVVEIGTMYGGV